MATEKRDYEFEDGNVFSYGGDDDYDYPDDSGLRALLSQPSDESRQSDDDFNSLLKPKSISMKPILVGSGVILAVGVLAGVVFFNPFGALGGNQNFGNTHNTEELSQSKTGIGQETYNEEEDFYLEDGKFFPKDVYAWAQEETPSDSSNLSEIGKSYSTTDVFLRSNILPSEAAGFTSNMNSQFDDENNFNPMYAFWTQERFTAETGDLLERLLNPTYGGWGVYQYDTSSADKNFDLVSMNDLFTQSYLERHADDPYSDYVPVYADWDSNNYGMADQLLTSGPRWFGEIQNGDLIFTYDDNNNQYSAEATFDVIFTAWNKTESTITKNGTLTLKLVPNNSAVDNNDRRVLIDGAVLKVDE